MFRNSWKLSKQIHFNYNLILTVRTIRLLTVHKAQVKEISSDKKSIYIDPDWNTALPYKKIPGPSKLGQIFHFLPGGRYYNVPIQDLQVMLRRDYGEIVKFPGLFRRSDIVFIFDPNDFSKLFRTEGVWPTRIAMESLAYFKKLVRPDIYKNMGGLVTEQGESWFKMRSIVNPVMMQPKTIKIYVPGVDAITKEFIEKIYKIRDTNNEVPANFNIILGTWAFESIAFITFNTRLRLLNDQNNNTDGSELIQLLREFFILSNKLDNKPSLWRYYKTSNFKKLMKTLDRITSIVFHYIDIETKKINSKLNNADEKHEEGVIEKLLRIDPHIAMVMAHDMLIAGADTTGSVSVSILNLLAKNPDKQQKLREEIMTILPEKNSDFTIENSKNLPYLRACIKETLRIHPIASGNLRNAGHNLTFQGYQVPNGTSVVCSEYMHHLSDEMFPEPYKFIPERWLKSEKEKFGCSSTKKHHPFVYLPFGIGIRSCIGKRLAELEMEILISRIIRNFTVEWHYPEIKYSRNIIISASGDLKFRFIENEK